MLQSFHIKHVIDSYGLNKDQSGVTFQ